jgi:hypothetical protein
LCHSGCCAHLTVLTWPQPPHHIDSLTPTWLHPPDHTFTRTPTRCAWQVLGGVLRVPVGRGSISRHVQGEVPIRPFLPRSGHALSQAGVFPYPARPSFATTTIPGNSPRARSTALIRSHDVHVLPPLTHPVPRTCYRLPSTPPSKTALFTCLLIYVVCLFVCLFV